jgi:Zn-dependent protease with chaperone function
MRHRTPQDQRLLLKRNLKGLISVLLLLPLTPLIYAQSATPQFPDPGKTSMSRQEQQALGLQVAAKVYEQMPVLPDNSTETQYVRQIGQKLVATIPTEHSWPFEFHVVPQKEINAFALPGGQMFINVGTITAAANEAELAGVMGHEMAHVYMQHSAKQAGKAQTTSTIAGIASAVLGRKGGLAGQLGQMGIQLGAQGLMAKYSRGDEAEADAVGAVILYQAGYNPQGMADFFKTLAAGSGPSGPAWFSSHPDPGNRQQAVQKRINDWPAKKYTAENATWEEVRQHAMQLRVYTGQEIAQGATSGQWDALNKKSRAAPDPDGKNVSNRTAEPGAPARTESSAPAKVLPVSLESVLPSGHMKSFDLGPVKILRPENWQVSLPQKQGEFLTIAPQAGTSGDAVGYGMVLKSVMSSQGERTNLDETTSRLVLDLQRQGLELLSNAQPITVAGIEGRSVMLQSPSPFPTAKGEHQKERDWLVTALLRDGSAVIMIFVAPEPDFVLFQPIYESILATVQIK